ncbi:MAG: hypothetical protein QXI33_02060 [Candidatus Pacearchaeota archaeon]
MKKKEILISFTITIILFSISFISAAETKLLCLNNGDTIRFSKCNSLIPDRTCQNNMGCQYCVSEISKGIYCPRNINECNSLGLSCSDNSNANLIPDQNSNENSNEPPSNPKGNIDIGNTGNIEDNDNNSESNNQENVNVNLNNNINNENKTNGNVQDNSEDNETDNNENLTKENEDLISKIKTLFSTPIKKDDINKSEKNVRKITGKTISNETKESTKSDNPDTITIKKTTFYTMLLYIPFLIELGILILLLIYDNYKKRFEKNKNSKDKHSLKREINSKGKS